MHLNNIGREGSCQRTTRASEADLKMSEASNDAVMGHISCDESSSHLSTNLFLPHNELAPGTMNGTKALQTRKVSEQNKLKPRSSNITHGVGSTIGVANQLLQRRRKDNRGSRVGPGGTTIPS